MTKHPSPNEQRSDVKNPNNPGYEADIANWNAQRHPGVPLAVPAPTPPNPKGGPGATTKQ